MGCDDTKPSLKNQGESDFKGPAIESGFEDPTIEAVCITIDHCIIGPKRSFSLGCRDIVAGDVGLVLVIPMKEHSRPFV